MRVESASLATLIRLQTKVANIVTNRALHWSRVTSAIQIMMPSLSSTMEEATIVKWIKAGR